MRHLHTSTAPAACAYPRAMRIALVAVLVSGCMAGPVGPEGPQGPTGPEGLPARLAGAEPDGGLTGGAVDCTPGALFCDGGKLWSCTRSGADAVVSADCALAGSSNNPGVCSTAGCPAGQAACCTRSKATCAADLLVGGVAATSPSCVQPEPPTGACSETAFTARILSSAADTCGQRWLTVSSRRPMPSSVVTMPVDGVSVDGFGCSDWTGSIALTDAPNWRVEMNLTCSFGLKAGLTLVGSVSGAL